MKKKVVNEFIVPKCTGKAFIVKKGQVMSVIQIDGGQVADIRFFNTQNYPKVEAISDNQAKYIKEKFEIDASIYLKPIVFSMADYYLVLIGFLNEGPTCADLFIFDKNGKLKKREEAFLMGSSGSEYTSNEYAILRGHKNNHVNSVNTREETDKGISKKSYRYFVIDETGTISVK